jgi:hypothetical protein
VDAGVEALGDQIGAYIEDAMNNGFDHDSIPAEQEAEAFAQLLEQALKNCMDSCKCR